MAIDMMTYTLSENGLVTVNVAEFRQRISHLEDLVHRDYHACKGVSERSRWVEIAKRIGAELIGTTCKRATVDDWNRRERAIERSVELQRKCIGL